MLYTASADDKLEIELNTSSILSIKRNIDRGAPAYGILDCNDASTLAYIGDIYLQNVAENAGSGTGDIFDFQNITINNSHAFMPQLTLLGETIVQQQLTLTDGILSTTSSNLLTIAAGGSSSTGSNASHVDGPMKKIGNTVFEFPVGDEGIWQPISINNLSGDASTEFTAQYFHQNPTNSDLVNFPLNNVSTLEYWDLSNTGTASTADVTLHWKDQNSSRSMIMTIW